MRDKFKIQIYLDSNKPNKEIGYCEVMLADLLTNERMGGSNSAVIEKDVQITAVPILNHIFA